MSITKNAPKTNISRKETINKAKTKKDSVLPADNILSDDTSTRLDDDVVLYNAAAAAITTAKRAQANAVALAKPQRILLKTFSFGFVKSLNNAIDLGLAPYQDRAFFDLDISNSKLPDLSSDVKLINFAKKILSGDIERRAAGGMVMSIPSIAQFTIVYNAAKPLIEAVGAAKITLTLAKNNLNSLNVEIDDLIVHVWGEAEAKYSLLDAPARRVICREWSVRYVSKGVASLVSGIVTDSITGLPLSGASVRIAGSSGKSVADASGHYAINTVMFGDLELIAVLAGYTDAGISFTKVDGEPIVVDVPMEAE